MVDVFYEFIDHFDIRKNHIMKSIILFFAIFVFSIGHLDAQLLDEPQWRVLGKLGIKKIQKTIVSDSINSDFLWIEQELNHLGFNIKELQNSSDGRTTIYKSNYLDDSILVENQFIHLNEPNIKTKYTKYTYTKDLKQKTHSYYDGDHLLMKATFKYSKNGQLTSREERQFGDPKTNSYSSQRKFSYNYNEEGKVKEVHLKTKRNGKTDIKNYKNIYLSDPYTVEHYLVSSNGGEDRLLDKEIYDDQNRLKVTEHFNIKSKSSTYHFGNTKLELMPGESLRKEYFCDDRGLIVLEVISANRNQRIEIRYDYF